MQMICRGKSLFSALGLFLLVSCAQMPPYHEPDLPPAKAAILAASLPVWIISIDGAHVSNWGTPDDRRIRVLPGPHTVELAYRAIETKFKDPRTQIGPEMIEHDWTWSIGNIKVLFLAFPGRTYYVNYRREGHKWGAAIGDFKMIGAK